MRMATDSILPKDAKEEDVGAAETNVLWCKAFGGEDESRIAVVSFLVVVVTCLGRRRKVSSTPKRQQNKTSRIVMAFRSDDKCFMMSLDSFLSLTRSFVLLKFVLAGCLVDDNDWMAQVELSACGQRVSQPFLPRADTERMYCWDHAAFTMLSWQQIENEFPVGRGKNVAILVAAFSVRWLNASPASRSFSSLLMPRWIKKSWIIARSAWLGGEVIKRISLSLVSGGIEFTSDEREILLSVPLTFHRRASDSTKLLSPPLRPLSGAILVLLHPALLALKQFATRKSLLVYFPLFCAGEFLPCSYKV